MYSRGVVMSDMVESAFYEELIGVRASNDRLCVSYVMFYDLFGIRRPE